MTDKPRRILLVEDDPDIRRVTRATLAGAGYEVSEAEDGRQGIEAVRKSRPDLVLVDVMMPQMNGVEFCRSLVEDLGLADLPVLIVSSVNEKSALIRSLADVALQRKEFLKKPVGPVELKMRVAQMLGLEKPASSPVATAPSPKAPASVASGGDAPGHAGAHAHRAGRQRRPRPTAPRLRVMIVDDDSGLLADPPPYAATGL
jgi:CheY-like chemotaxis protein